MPDIDDFIDELSSSSYSSEYDNYSEYSTSDTGDDNFSESEDEVWSGKRKVAKKQPGTPTDRPKKSVKCKRSKREEYEGVTDSESSLDEDVKKSDEAKSIPFTKDKGWTVEGVVDYKDDQFLIKWASRSYRECTWIRSEDIEASVLRKAQNCQERIQQMSDDDLEETKMSRELYSEPERIVGMHVDGGKYYLVKWRGLAYKEATWEADTCLFPDHRDLIDAFLSRWMVRKSGAGQWRWPKAFSKVRPSEAFLPTQLQLRDYQLDGVNWLAFAWLKQVNVILADEMGLGKTIQSVTFLMALHSKYSFPGPTLVVVPLSTIDAWQREFARWAGALNVVCYIGDATSRALIRSLEFYRGDQIVFDVLLTTYELVLKDIDDLRCVKWRQLIVDEGHRLKNKDSQLFEALDQLMPSHHRLLITGTPLQNSLKELWSLLHFLDSPNFPDYEAFDQQYAPAANETPEEAENRTHRLHALLKPHLLRRMKKDVEQSLPGKREQILRVDLSPEQKELYKLVLSKNYCELLKAKHSHGSLANILAELKKICNHPMVFAGQIVVDKQALLRQSSKLALMDMLLARLISEGHRVLIFSQSVKMLDVLGVYLSLRQWSFQRLDGSVSSEHRRRAIDAFNAVNSPSRCFLLSTRAGGLGINLETADTVIIYDSDWNPQNDMQAMARAHRIGQKSAVNIYRLVTLGTVEETILERAKDKMVLDHLIIQRMHPTGDSGELQTILKFGAQSLFSNESNAPDRLDLDAILSRAQEPLADREDDSGEFLGQFKVADVGALPAWEQIIPEDDRKRAEAARTEAELLAKEGALQEAILTSTTVRKSRGKPVARKGPDAAGLKQDVQDAMLTGRTSEALARALKEDRIELAGVKAEAIRRRLQHFAALSRALQPVTDLSSFRLAVPVKPPTGWSRPWTPRDDAMVLAGVSRHGLNMWAVIKEQFGVDGYDLRKGTLPQSSHLQRRFEYLVGLLQKEEELKSKVARKKSRPKQALRPSKESRSRRRGGEAREAGAAKELRGSSASIEIRQGRKSSRCDAIEDLWPSVRHSLKPVKKQLEFLSSLSPSHTDTSINEICTSIRLIGQHIDTLPAGRKADYWQAVSHFFPTDITPTEMLELYERVSGDQN